MNKALVYLQSGGPTAVINSSLAGAIMAAKEAGVSAIFGSHYGIEGLLDDDLIDLTNADEDFLTRLQNTPGAYLGSSRKKIAGDESALEKIAKTVEKHNIGYILINGGNDSMDTGNALSAYFKDKGVRVIGVPKTVDNDLICCDHTPGFGSAAKFVINTVANVVIDGSSYKKGKITLVEIMGRNAGWLTASTDLLPEGLRPDMILIPERPVDLDRFLAECKEIYDRKHYAVLAISEGVNVPRPKVELQDAFGNIALEGIVAELAALIKERLGIGARSTVLSTPSRACPAYISASDRSEAIEAGKVAVRSALEGKSGYMVAITRESNSPYKAGFPLVPLSEVANQVHTIPESMLGDDFHMDPSFREYILPLVAGEAPITYDDIGLVAFAK